MDFGTQFAKLEGKAARSRKTIAEMLESAGVSRLSYWRAKKGKYAKTDTTISILRKCEAALDETAGRQDHEHNGKAGPQA